MWAKVRDLFEKHRRVIMGLLLVIVVAIWVSQPLQKALPFEAAIAVTTSAILMFVILILDYLITLKRPSGIEIYENEVSVRDRLETYIKEQNPTEVKLIEYSTGSIDSLLRLLDKTDCSIQLLICDPWEAISPFQREKRICNRIIQFPAIIKKPSKFKVRCYPGNGSIRGRNFDDRFITLGWYTYDVDPEVEKSYSEKQIWGDTNNIIVSSVETTGGKTLMEMFNRVFGRLWKKGIPLEDVCGKCREREKCSGPPDIDWLRKTNPDNYGGNKS